MPHKLPQSKRFNVKCNSNECAVSLLSFWCWKSVEWLNEEQFVYSDVGWRGGEIATTNYRDTSRSCHCCCFWWTSVLTFYFHSFRLSLTRCVTLIEIKNAKCSCVPSRELLAKEYRFIIIVFFLSDKYNIIESSWTTFAIGQFSKVERNYTFYRFFFLCAWSLTILYRATIKAAAAAPPPPPEVIIIIIVCF